MKINYCPICGEKLTLKEFYDEGLVKFCTSCNKPYFNCPRPCVFMVVKNLDNKYLIIKQSYGKRNYRLVSGFIKLNENIEEAALRELKEETGLDGFNLSYIKSYYQDGFENLMIGILVHVKDDTLSLSSEVSYASFYSLDEALPLLKDASYAYDLLSMMKLKS